MIVRTLQEVENSEFNIAWGNGDSRRLLTTQDGLGFSVCDTLVKAGSASLLQYRNHLEACYCLEGEGEIEDETGQVYRLTPNTLYALNKHDKHILRAKTDMRLISVFNPPLNGNEKHNLTDTAGSSY